MMRILVQLDAPTNDDFDKEVHLLSTNDNVHNHNRTMLHSFGYPIAHSLATKTWNGNIVQDGSIDELDLELLISKDSRVMLTKNLWIEVGLVNGVLGDIWSIVYKLGTGLPKPQTYVKVEFDNYSRIPFDDTIQKLFL